MKILVVDDRPENLLVTRTMLDELGGWDAGFRHYCEDIDLCYRAARAGWERWYVPDAVVTHRWDAFTDKKFLTRRTLCATLSLRARDEINRIVDTSSLPRRGCSRHAASRNR